MLRKLNPTTDLEHRIIGTLLDELLENGYIIEIEIVGCEQYFYVRTEDETEGKAKRWVKLVRGNGASVISDYSPNLENDIKPALELADLYEN